MRAISITEMGNNNDFFMVVKFTEELSWYKSLFCKSKEIELIYIHEGNSWYNYPIGEITDKTLMEKLDAVYMNYMYEKLLRIQLRAIRKKGEKYG